MRNTMKPSPFSRPTRAWAAFFSIFVIISLACALPGFSRPTPTPAPAAQAPAAAPTPLPTAAPQASPTPLPPMPPVVAEIVPSPSDALPLKSALTLYFSQDMQPESVLSAVTLNPPITGKFEWLDPATLSFIPAEALPPFTSLTLTVAAGAQAANGLGLPEPFSAAYRTTAPLKVVQQLPPPFSTGISPQSAVSITFSQPIVPLGQPTEDLPPAFTLSPAVEGRGEWLNTDTYVFYPNPALSGGVQYTAALTPQFTALAGVPFSADVTQWNFTAAPPKLMQIAPTSASLLFLDQIFTLGFNQPMNPSSLEEKVSLRGPDGSAFPLKFTWSENDSRVEIQPTVLLPRSTNVTFALEPGALSAGGVALGDSFSQPYTSSGNLTFSLSSPRAGESLMLYGGYSSINIQANLPLARQEIDSKITIQPAIDGLNLNLYNQRQSISLSGYFQPQTSYTLTFDASLRDAYDQPLGQNQTLTFSTAPVSPTLRIPSIYLGSGVLFLPAAQKTLSVEAVNLKNASLSVTPITLDEMVNLTLRHTPGQQISLSAPTATWTTPINAPANRYQMFDVALTSTGDALDTGLYWLNLSSPELGENAGFVSPIALAVSNVHLTLKRSATQVTVWATDLTANTPIPNLNVQLWDYNVQNLGYAVTDAQGIAKWDVPTTSSIESTLFALSGSPGAADFGIAYSGWSYGITGWQFGYENTLEKTGLSAYLYTDRPIYRPGQEVFIRSILYRKDNGRYTPPDVPSATLSILRGDYYDYDQPDAQLASIPIPLDSFGAGSASYTLPEDLQPGRYTLSITSPEEVNSSVVITVAEYRKPEVELSAAFASPDLTTGQPLQGEVKLRYYFGTPAAGVNVNWSLYAQRDHFALPGGYVTGKTYRGSSAFDASPYSTLGSFLTSGVGLTDAEGLLKVELSPEELADLLDPEMRYILTLEATIADESNLPVSTRAQVTYHPQAVYASVRPDAWNAVAGQESGFSVLTVDLKGQPAGNRKLQAVFSPARWEFGQSPDQDWQLVIAPAVSTADFVTDSAGRARLAFTPPTPGTYLLQIRGEAAPADVFQWVVGGSGALWPRLPDQRLELRSDTEAYTSGQTARVLIPNPFSGPALAWVTVERAKIMRSQVITIDSASQEFSLTLTPEDAPNVYVAVTLLGRDSSGLLDFRQGLIELRVDPQDLLLSLTLTADPPRAAPGSPVNLTLKAVDSQGQPVQGEFSIAVVDKAVLALAEPNAQPIPQAFYKPQPLGVLTSIPLTAYANRFKPIALGRGGGGGAGDMGPGSVREKFQDTALWEGSLRTDASGQASLRLTLPDNLTTWVVTARGLDAAHRVGESETEIVTSKDLLIRPVLPRFVIAGDHLELAAVVHNNTNRELAPEVSLTAAGFTLDDPAQASRRVQIGPGERLRLAWWGTVQDVNALDLLFSAAAENLSDSVRPESGTLPVNQYTASQTFASAGTLAEAGERVETLSLPRSFNVTSGELRLELTPSLVSAILNSLDVLTNQTLPGYNPEAVLSRLLPNLVTYQTLSTMGLDMASLQRRLQNQLRPDLNRLLDQQNPDGGWDWSGDRDESDPFLSAYAYYTLTQAQSAGFTTPSYNLDNAYAYISGVSQRPLPEITERNTVQEELHVFLNFVLWETRGEVSPHVDALIERRADLAPWAKAMLIPCLVLPQQNDQRLTLLSDLETLAVRSATGAHWEAPAPNGWALTSPHFNTALAVYALSRFKSDSVVLEDAVRYLVANRSPQGIWSSQYETAWILLALNQYVLATNDVNAEFAFSAAFNQTPILTGQAAAGQTPAPVTANLPLSQISANSSNQLAIQRQSGPGRLYYRAYLQVNRPAAEVPPVRRGLSISRQVFLTGQDCRTSACQPVTSVIIGPQPSTIYVRLTLTLPTEMNYLVVEDFAPAGAEIVNPALKTAQQGITPSYTQNPPSLEEGWGWWWFSQAQVYDNRIRWTARQLPPGTYQLTYRLSPYLPGEFRVLPAHAYQLYFPEIEASSGGSILEIKP